jgi:two-component system, NtrC family, sensor histidine kinase PilS
VFNKHRGIELLNNSARNLLGLPPEQTSRLSLRDVPALDHKVTQWQQAKKQYSPILKIDNGLSDEVKINFAPLESDENTDTLIFVEDNRAIAQQAQQLKLASLGRLTASIAHEIRNPLGAISHASQLLGESETMSAHDQRLIEIINSHCKRVNQIIENVLQLSRRRMAQPQQVHLNSWIERFMEEYKNSRAEPVDLKVICLEPNIVGQFDPGQLHQVINNLCDNGLRYSKIAGGKASVTLEIGVDEKLQRPYINVIDSGPGIAPENLKHLFEPFFTTENTGSGLGLFICKELCEANQAFIHYRRTEDGSSCFHIQLAHHERAL